MKIYNNIIFYLLLLIIVISSLNVYIFNWQELVRIFLILVAIILVYSKYLKKFTNIQHHTIISEINPDLVKSQKELAVITAILFIFLVSQFDPSTNTIQKIVITEKFNWYFITTFIGSLVLLCSIFIFILKFRKSKDIELTKFNINADYGDKFVISLLVVLSFVGFFSRLFLSKKPDWGNYFFIELKLIQYLILWFVIKYLIFFEVKFQNQVDKKVLRYSLISIGRIKKLYVGLSLLLLFSILFGSVRILGVYNLFQEARDLSIKNDKLQEAINLNNKTLDRNRILNLNFINSGCLENLAHIYIKMDSLKRFNEILGIIKNNNKGNEKIEKLTGDIYFKADRLDFARKEYEAFLEKGFIDSDVINNLGKCYLRDKNISGIIKLIKDYNYSPLIQSADKDDYILVGNAFIETGYFNQAKESFEKALELDETNSYIYYKLGRINFEISNFDSAIRNFERATQLDTSFADAYYRLGMCFEKKGDKKKALQYFERTVKILPNHFDGLIKLKEYYDILIIGLQSEELS